MAQIVLEEVDELDQISRVAMLIEDLETEKLKGLMSHARKRLQ